MLWKPVLAAVALGGLSVAGCGITGPAHTSPPPSRVEATIKMGFTSFNPESITIESGQTVQWRNTSLIMHTVTADKSMAADPAHVELPQGAESFHSGDVVAGAVWSYTFTVPGTYHYVCLPHEQQGMLGTIIVE